MATQERRQRNHRLRFS